MATWWTAVLDWAQQFLGSADGPSTPFASAGLDVADSVRLVCIIGGLVVLASTPGLARLAQTGSQRLRFLALGAFAFVAATTELQHLGDTASYRLAVNLAGVMWAVVGYQLPRRLHPRGGGHRRGW